MKQWITSAGAVILAFLASQHHNLHMLLLVLGMSSAASMSFVYNLPILRRGMLLMSLLMIGITLMTVIRKGQRMVIRTLNVLSILISLGFIVWTIYQFGF